ncbi:protein RAE1-like [Carex rostrata]
MMRFDIGPFRLFLHGMIERTKGTRVTMEHKADCQVLPSPSDSVSSLSFSPTANHLVATSWDKQVRCWEISSESSRPVSAISHDQPVLCSTWTHDGNFVFSGGCDMQVKMWPIAAGAQPITVAMHDAPVRNVAWIPQMDLLVSSSWDKTIRYWDCRQAKPVHIQQLPDKCYALSVNYPLMVAGTADRNIIVFHLQNPQIEFKRIQSSLKHQTRCVAAFPNQQGFLVGSIEGRVGVHHLDESKLSKNYTFKCHRDAEKICSVNSINFHPVHHTFVSTGTDGTINFWDKDIKQRLKFLPKCHAPIPCGAFNADGSKLAYTVCYDWSKGAAHHDPSTATSQVYIYDVQVVMLIAHTFILILLKYFKNYSSLQISSTNE